MKSILVLLLFALLLPLGTGVASAQQKCDGLPHPDKGQPAPCYPTNNSTSPLPPLPNTQQQEQQRQQKERDRIHRCQVQAKQEYDSCEQKRPAGSTYDPCVLRQCY